MLGLVRMRPAASRQPRLATRAVPIEVEGRRPAGRPTCESDGMPGIPWVGSFKDPDLPNVPDALGVAGRSDDHPPSGIPETTPLPAPRWAGASCYGTAGSRARSPHVRDGDSCSPPGTVYTAP